MQHAFCTYLCLRRTTTTWNCLISCFVENGNTRQQLSFSFPELWYSPLEFKSKPFANIWRIKRAGISAIKFESARIHFLSDVFVRSRRRRWCLNSLLGLRRKEVFLTPFPPCLLLHRFLVRRRFSFCAAVSLTLRITKEKRHQKKPPATQTRPQWHHLAPGFYLNCNSLCCFVRGADPVFFLGGGALVSCSTSTSTLQNTSCIRKPQVISGGGGVRTPCTLPLDPPLCHLCLYFC